MHDNIVMHTRRDTVAFSCEKNGKRNGLLLVSCSCKNFSFLNFLLLPVRRRGVVAHPGVANGFLLYCS